MNLAPHVLRVLGMVGVIAGIVDPGCRDAARQHLHVRIAGDVAPEARTRALQAVASAAPWAVVIDEADPASIHSDTTPAVATVVVGPAAPVLRALEQRRADLALEVDDEAVTIQAIVVPGRVVAGMRTDIRVGVGDVVPNRGVVRVTVRDADSGVEQARVDAPLQPTNGLNPGRSIQKEGWTPDPASSRGVSTPGEEGREHVTVTVPWMATGEGPHRLLVEASRPDVTGGPPPASAVASIDVLPSDVRVAVLEARPTWSARFARLALQDVDGVRLTTDVRLAPGVAVRTTSAGDGDASTAGGDDEAQVRIVGGLDALTSEDVAALERAVRDRGRAVVLLADEVPAPGPWRRLWPDPTGSLRQSVSLATGRIGGHAWKMREWLDLPPSTAVTPLASLDAGSTPFVAGRGLGAGRVVLVAALDAWRWRAEDDAAYAAGWRALVQRLAADVPEPVESTVWVTGHGRQRWLHVAVAVRADVVARDPAVAAVVTGDDDCPVPLQRVASGTWRGAVRAPEAAGVEITTTATAAAEVVGRAQDVVDLGPFRRPAAWLDVTRHQVWRGGVAAPRGQWSDALTQVRTRLAGVEGARWYMTRTWGFAALVLALLGTEWILRRLNGAR